tara:strand:+ start:1550 stop:2341 length:792 start_codon:yes stop_codon:yes gene_type:complete
VDPEIISAIIEAAGLVVAAFGVAWTIRKEGRDREERTERREQDREDARIAREDRRREWERDQEAQSRQWREQQQAMIAVGVAEEALEMLRAVEEKLCSIRASKVDQVLNADIERSRLDLERAVARLRRLLPHHAHELFNRMAGYGSAVTTFVSSHCAGMAPDSSGAIKLLDNRGRQHLNLSAALEHIRAMEPSPLKQTTHPTGAELIRMASGEPEKLAQPRPPKPKKRSEIQTRVEIDETPGEAEPELVEKAETSRKAAELDP